MTDLTLTIAHHVLVFALVGVFAAEVALVRDGVGPPTIRLLGKLDAGYALLAAAVITVGFLRVLYSLTGIGE